MRLFTTWNLKLNKADDGQGGSGAKPEDKPPVAPNAKEVEGEGDRLDDFGYEVPPKEGADDQGGKEGKKSEVPKTEPAKVEKPATGYGDDVEDVEPPAPPKEEEIKLDFELKTEGLDKEEEKKLLSFFKKHGASKELAQALVDQRREEIKESQLAQEEAEKQAEIERKRVRSTWNKELKEDPNFGGEKFGHNILRAEKVVEEFMPDLKKRLTETKGMLPPYIMRGLVNIANQLYSTEGLVHGDATKPADDSKEADDPLAFYNS